MKQKKYKYKTQIIQALDGRSQRWLALKMNINEPDLSNKLNGFKEFSLEDIGKLNEILNINIPLNGNH